MKAALGWSQKELPEKIEQKEMFLQNKPFWWTINSWENMSLPEPLFFLIINHYKISLATFTVLYNGLNWKELCSFLYDFVSPVGLSEKETTLLSCRFLSFKISETPWIPCNTVTLLFYFFPLFFKAFSCSAGAVALLQSLHLFHGVLSVFRAKCDCCGMHMLLSFPFSTQLIFCFSSYPFRG